MLPEEVQLEVEHLRLISATFEPYFERFRRCRGRQKLKIVHLLAPNNLQIFSTEPAFLMIMEAF